jgi:hypothetical protein
VADFFDQNPYLRRYQVTPEQQQAYDRYVLSQMRLGVGAGNQADMQVQPLAGSSVPPDAGIVTTGTDAQSGAASPTAPAVPLVPADRSLVVAPPPADPGMLGTLPAPLPVGAMQPNGFPVHPNPNAPTNMPVSPALMQPRQDSAGSGPGPSGDSPSFARRVLDGFSTDLNWLETRASKLLGGVAGIPRGLVENADALARYVGVPPQQLYRGPLGSLLAGLSAYKDYLPTSDDAANFSRRGFGTLPYVPPDVNLPGPLGAMIDKSAEGVLGTLATGGTNLPQLFGSAVVGAGSEAANQLARRYDQAHGTNSEPPVRLFGDVLGLTR